MQGLTFHLGCSAGAGRLRYFLNYFTGSQRIYKKTMNLSLILFLIGILGFILNRKNIILMIISIEIMLLAVTLLVLISSYSFDDNIGQTFSVYIIAIAGAESVIGLSILVAYYRLRGTISLRT
jgi:NADH-ubiquinone oxidoreductase chain 4L